MRQPRRSDAESDNWIKRHPILAVLLLPVIPTVIGGLLVLIPDKGFDVFADTQNSKTSQSSTSTSTFVGNPSLSSAPAPSLVLSQGHTVLVTVDGLDLDTGERGYQDDPGMDISPSGDGKQINGMTHGKPKMAVVTTSDPIGPELCETIPLNAWVTPLPGLYGMRVGQRICVQTDQGNYGVLTLRAVPSARAVQLDIDYIAWAP
jgi:hypothetical protein